jgi:sucrose-6-phosphate hydrolase SacC (GH32 family)
MHYFLILISVFFIFSCSPSGQESTQGPGFHFIPKTPVNGNLTAVIQVRNTFNIFYPADQISGMGWKVSSSSDLMTWNYNRNVINGCDEVPISNPKRLLSGAIVGDSGNVSGLCNSPDCLLFLQAAWPCQENFGKTFEVLRKSEDGGTTWINTQGSITTDIELGRVKDPDIFYHQKSGSWIMLAATDQKIHFFGSSDLRQWRLLSSFGPAGNTDLQWEKPQLLELPVAGMQDEKLWLLTITSGHPAGKGFSAVQYFIGKFDGKIFVPETPEARLLDYGRDFISTVRVQLADEAGNLKPIISGKIGNLLYGDELPDKRLHGMLAFPRMLSFKKSGNQTILIQQPFSDLPDSEPIKRVEDLTGILNARITIKMPVSLNEKKGIHLLKTANQFIEIGYDPASNSVYVDRSYSGFTGFHPEFSGSDKYVLRDKPENIDLTIYLDQNLVEVFVMNGEAVISSLVFPENLYGKAEWFGPHKGNSISGIGKR